MTDEERLDGLTVRELLMEVRDDVKELRAYAKTRDDFLDKELQRLDQAVNQRPTRAEVFSLVGAATAFAGVVFTFARLLT